MAPRSGRVMRASWSLIAARSVSAGATDASFFLVVPSGLRLPLSVQADPGRFRLVGATRSDDLNCEGPASDKRLSWAEALLDSSASATGIEREGEIDGRARYAGEEIMSLVQWTRPVHDPSRDRQVIFLSAADMNRPTALRLRADTPAPVAAALATATRSSPRR